MKNLQLKLKKKNGSNKSSHKYIGDSAGLITGIHSMFERLISIGIFTAEEIQDALNEAIEVANKNNKEEN